MVFWKVKTDLYADARSSRRSLPLFLNLLLVGALFYGFSELSYLIYSKVFEAIKTGYMNYEITVEWPILQDFNLIARSSLFLILGIIGTLYVRVLEGRKLSTMGYRAKKLAGGILGGLGIAILLVGGMLAVFAFVGIFNFQGEVAPDLVSCLADALALLIAGFCFEYFFRGFLLSSLGARCRMIIAVFFTALLSTIAHSLYWGWNLYSAYNNFLFNLLLTLLVVRTGNAWISAAVRSFWLILCQLFFGILYSGQACYHKLIPNTLDYQNDWAGSSCVDCGNVFTAIMIIGILLVVFLPKKDPHEDEEENKPFFQHVPVEKKPEAAAPAKAAAPAPVKAEKVEPVAAAPVINDAAEASDEDDDDDWDDEETRGIVHPEFKNPEKYLK